jgi:DNA-binding NarL/FixJ family response regulator
VNDHPVRVLCVDDNRLIADALARRLDLEPDLEWAGWIEQTSDLERVLNARPGVVMLDIDMPGCDPFELVRRLAESSPSTRVLMFSGHVRTDYIDRAIDAGAWGYVSKNESIEDVLAAIRRVASGEFVTTSDVNAAYLAEG